MKIIDGHIHIGKWGDVFHNYYSTVVEAVEVMKKSKVAAAVAMPADATPNNILLTEIKNIIDFKFYFCAWINPEDKKLDDFLDYNIKDIHFFKIHPSLQRKRVTDESYKKYIELALENNIPVVIHCGRWFEIAHFSYALEIARKYPALKIILAHLGGDQPTLCISCADNVRDKQYKNVYLGSESVREFHFVNEVVQRVGAEKVIFGSDYNLGLPKMYFPVIDSLRITLADRELIYSGNIQRLIDERERN